MLLKSYIYIHILNFFLYLSLPDLIFIKFALKLNKSFFRERLIRADSRLVKSTVEIFI